MATTLLPTHRDVDEPDDVDLVAEGAPGTRFADIARSLRPAAAALDPAATS